MTTTKTAYRRKPGICATCGAPTPRKERVFCDIHTEQGRRQAIAESNSRRWQEWKAAGIDPCHTPEARAAISAAVSQANHDNPKRKAKQQ